ncbi:MAG: hypothetical protein M1526_02815 [Candidatus Thermoplasmatota archaeon]|jgi:hypothetical protein|nr:hypothetical protein [Candidatus Thermoplasmatota archaeon]
MKMLSILLIAVLAVSMPVTIVHGQANLDIKAPAVTNNSTQINGIVQRAFGLVAGVSGLIIAILWVPIAVGYFSKDLDRKADAKERTKDALIGTVLFVMAISGVLYAVVHFIVVG